MQAVEKALRIAVLLPFTWLGACAQPVDAPTDDQVPPGGFLPPVDMGAGGAAAPNDTPIPGGNVATPPPGGAAGAAGVDGTLGAAGAGIVDPGNLGGAGGAAGSGAMAGSGAPAPMGTGACCADGNCLCHGDAPSALTSDAGPYQTASFTISTGEVYYPTDAEPPFAVVALCAGFLNTGPEMVNWGPFYASHGIVTVITTTTGADLPDVRGAKLLAALDDVKAEAGMAGNALNGKLSDRLGTSGYSMGGGGTTIASGSQPTLKTSVGLAPWGPIGEGVQVPTLLLCGDADVVAPCDMAQGAYDGIPAATPKMLRVISGATHFNWFGPKDGDGGTSGATALAFQKVYLEGDTRWLPLLKGLGASVQTNIQ